MTRDNSLEGSPPPPFVIGLTFTLSVPFVMTGDFLVDLLIGSGLGVGATTHQSWWNNLKSDREGRTSESQLDGRTFARCTQLVFYEP